MVLFPTLVGGCAITIIPSDRIFIHSSWRSGGTYFWGKFRRHRSVYGYYEPLFEGLADIDAATIFTDRSAMALGHTLTAPSKLEYLPLLTPHGVIDFPQAYSYGSYFLRPAEEAPALQAYFSRLACFADQHRRVPVFGMVRSGSRIGWFKQYAGGCHIAVRRAHRQRWISYLHRAVMGDDYFVQRGLIILGCNRDHPALAGLRQLLRLPDLGAGPDGAEAYSTFIRSLTIPLLYLIFAYLERLGRIEAERHADLVIDLDAVTGDAEAAREAEDRIAALTGFAITLKDCALPRYDELLLSWSHVYDEIDGRITEALVPADALV